MRGESGGEHDVEGGLRQPVDDHRGQRLRGQEVHERLEEADEGNPERRTCHVERDGECRVDESGDEECCERHAERYLLSRSSSADTSAVSPESTTRPLSTT